VEKESKENHIAERREEIKQIKLRLEGDIIKL
jgi:hypothetical protein